MSNVYSTRLIHLRIVEFMTFVMNSSSLLELLNKYSLHKIVLIKVGGLYCNINHIGSMSLNY
jgi:hypothetical protein